MKNSLEIKHERSVKQGQVWKLGDHRLLCGNACDEKLVTSFLSSANIQAIVTDPPYGVSYAENKTNVGTPKVNKVILNDNISSESEYREFSKKWLLPVIPRLARKNSIYIFNSDKMLFTLRNALDDVGIFFSQLVIWVKSQAVIGRKDYMPQHELILFGWYGTHAFRRSKDKSILCYPKPNSSSLHPTMKPVPLVAHLIMNSTSIGDAVYDPFGGSGTTLIACEQTKRRCFMVEEDLEYCRTIIARWEHVTSLKAEKI
ncbi:MAG TPA: site-specific DNA-methyltransferase [Candidatus Paceibacterota bacterium]|nr:site-specific DNA-methyltransferase [Candidatus Paceibacterota bacterium]